MILRFLARICKYLMRIFFPFKVYGSKKRLNKGCIYVGNHVSGMDSVMFYTWTRGPMPSFMYKFELRKIFILRWIFWSFRGIPVKRGDADLQSTKMTIDYLSKGRNVCVFPEGHRNPAHNCLQEFRKGAALYALKSQCPIRVFYLWEKTKMFRKNYMMISDELTLDRFYDKPVTKALLAEVTEYIRTKTDELRIKLNVELAKKGKKHRKYTKKELKQIHEQYGEQAPSVIENTWLVEGLEVDKRNND